MVDHPRDGIPTDAERKWMVLRKSALRQDRRHYRNLEQLCKLHEFVRRLAPKNALSNVDEWLLGLQQQGNGIYDVSRISGACMTPHRRIRSLGLAEGLHDYVCWKLEQYRTSPAVSQVRKGPRCHLLSALSIVDRISPFGNAAVIVHGVEHRRETLSIECRTSGNH